MRYNLRRSSVILSVLSLLLVSHSLFAQKEKVRNLNDFDRKKIHFGFLLGVTNNSFLLKTNLNRVDSLISLNVQQQPGFNIGIVSDLHMGPLFNLRFIPQIAFASRLVEYSFLQPDGSIQKETKEVESTILEFPLNVKYRSDRLNNFAAYLVGGMKYSLDLASEHDVDNEFLPRNEIVVKAKPHSLSWELGFGMDFFLTYFKFSPEIKMAVGLDNLHIKENHVFSSPIMRMRSQVFLISFLFEG